MKKFFVIINLILPIILISFNKIDANSDYLYADDYITVSETEDVSTQFTEFLNECSKLNKSALFSDRVYLFDKSVNLVSGVSIYGSNETIFRGDLVNQQVNIFGKINNVAIKNIIFDNMTIYLGDTTSNNIHIENNIFVNAKPVDKSIDSGLISVYEGYYILLTHVSSSTIKSNIFLRDEESLGRGIGLYKTLNIEITDNYFGLLEDYKNSIVSSKTKNLVTKLLDLAKKDSIKLLDSDQGNFMTGINVLNGDENIYIKGNHLSLNKDLIEFNYESDKTSDNYYHRDHLIYAKQYNNLHIVGNYFKGMNKNQDGGVKCRDGKYLLVHKNVFDEVLLLLYVQNNSSYFKQTEVSNNIFINRSYSDEVLSYNVLGKTYNKYLTVDFLILFYNYYTNAILEDITIENNSVISDDLANDCITINAVSGANNNISNLYFENNKSILAKDLNVKLLKTTYTKGNKFSFDKSDYNHINVNDLMINDKDSFIIEEKKIIVSENIDVYVDGKLYQNEVLEASKQYDILLVSSQVQNILIDDPNSNGKYINRELIVNNYSNFKLDLLCDNLNISLYLGDKIHLNEVFNNYENFKDFVISSTKIDLVDDYLIAKSMGEDEVILSFSGYSISLNVIVEDSINKEYIEHENDNYILDVNDLEKKYNFAVNPSYIKENLDINLSVDNIVDAYISNGILSITPKNTGSVVVTVFYALNENIKKEITFNVVSKTTDIVIDDSYIEINAGKSYKLTPELIPSNSTEELEFISSNKDIVDVSSTGLLTAKAIGEVKIIVKSGNIIKEIFVKVIVTATDIHVVEEIILKAGEKMELDISTTPLIVSDELVISSLDDNIVITNDKWIEGIKPGTTKIIVSCGNISKEINVKIISNIENICFESEMYTIKLNESKKRFELIINPNVDNPNLGYRMDKDGIVYCSIEGNSLEVIPLKEGTVVITVYDLDNPSVYSNLIIMVEAQNTQQNGCSGSIISSTIGLVAMTCVIILIKFKRKRIY